MMPLNTFSTYSPIFELLKVITNELLDFMLNLKKYHVASFLCSNSHRPH